MTHPYPNGVQLRPAPPAPAHERADRVLSFAIAAALLLCLIVEGWVAATQSRTVAALDRLAQALEERESADADRLRLLDAAHQSLAVRQASLVSQHEKTRRLGEDNLRLAEEINRRLKGE